MSAAELGTKNAGLRRLGKGARHLSVQVRDLADRVVGRPPRMGRLPFIVLDRFVHRHATSGLGMDVVIPADDDSVLVALVNRLSVAAPVLPGETSDRNGSTFQVRTSRDASTARAILTENAGQTPDARPRLSAFITSPKDRVIAALRERDIPFGAGDDHGEAFAFIDQKENQDLTAAALTGLADPTAAVKMVRERYAFVGSVDLLSMSFNVLGRMNERNMLPYGVRVTQDLLPHRQEAEPAAEIEEAIARANPADNAIHKFVLRTLHARHDEWLELCRISGRGERGPKPAKSRSNSLLEPKLKPTRDLERGISNALDGISAAARTKGVGPALRARINAVCDNPLDAAQHLRNLMLAYSDGRLMRRMDKVPGIDGTTRAPLATIADYLDTVLAAHHRYEARDTLPITPKTQGGRRVLIVLDYIPDNSWMGAHARQVCSYAAGLILMPQVEAVEVLVTQETGPENPLLSGGEVALKEAGGWRDVVEGFLASEGADSSQLARKLSFTLPSRTGPVHRTGDGIEAARAFAPNCAIAFQGMYRSRVVADLVSDIAPVVAIQFNQYNPEPPFANLVLAHSFRPGFEDKPTPAKWRNHPIPLVPFQRFSDLPITVLSEETAFLEAKLRVATVLSQGRLEKGLLADDARDLRDVVAVLQNHRDVAWVMVGMLEPEAFLKEALIAVPALATIRDRIVFSGVLRDLRALYEHCNIYFHTPKLHGGAMGVAMAIDDGLPSLVRAGTDSANFIPADLTYHDHETAYRRLDAMLEDGTYRSRLVRRQAAYLRKHHATQATGRVLMRFMDELADT